MQYAAMSTANAAIATKNALTNGARLYVLHPCVAHLRACLDELEPSRLSPRLSPYMRRLRLRLRRLRRLASSSLRRLRRLRSLLRPSLRLRFLPS